MGIRTRGYHPAISAMRESMLLRQELLETQMENSIKKAENKKLRRSYWWQRLANAMADLRSTDPEGWEAWFDSDAVPEYGTEKSRALLVEARIRELLGHQSRSVQKATARLYRGVFIWRDQHGAFLFDESHRIYEFIDEAEAQGHVDATLAMCGSLLGALA
jgi:hypothetical protein